MNNFELKRWITSEEMPFLRVKIRGKVTKDQLSRLDTVTIPYVIHSFTLSKKREKRMEDDKKDHVFAT